MAKQGRTIWLPMIGGACVPVIEKCLRFCRLSPLHAAFGTQFLQLCSFYPPGIVKSEATPKMPALSQAFAANWLFKLKKPAVLQFCR
jgi:hypothetical protein